MPSLDTLQQEVDTLKQFMSAHTHNAYMEVGGTRMAAGRPTTDQSAINAAFQKAASEGA